MNAGLFVTGTDTECGKTYVSRVLLRLLRDRGVRVVGFKPVAAGASPTVDGLRNDDALTLLAEGSVEVPYGLVNPYCFAAPIAPHLAASDAGAAIDLASIRRTFAALSAQADAVIVEGAGGWLVPLGGDLDMAGLAAALDVPVLLVVGLRLGCLNHARLTERAILARGIALAGWIGTQVDPGMQRLDDNLSTLRKMLVSPCLGVLRHVPKGAPAADQACQLEAGAILSAIRRAGD